MAKDSQRENLFPNQTFFNLDNLNLGMAVVAKGMNPMEKKKIITPEPDFDSFQEWNPKEGFGIIPDGISLTQNLGCAGGKKPRENSKKKDKN